MKNFLKIVITIMYAAGVSSGVYAADGVMKIKAGTLVKVTPIGEISSLSADKGDKAEFINLQSMYIYETNAIPENTIFSGRIEDVREPVSGRDAAVKIVLDKMITPDKKVYNINSTFRGSGGSEYAGGKMTQKAYYHKIYHHSKGFKPFLQMAPLNVYEKGRHVIIRPGADYYIVIEDDIILK